jgi:hypothetical protein
MSGILYVEVEEWWENSEWSMSNYPPSSWHAYCVQEGMDLDSLQHNPEEHEEGVAELHANLEICPDCGEGHDRRPCIESAAMCDCCAAIEKGASSNV